MNFVIGILGCAAATVAFLRCSLLSYEYLGWRDGAVTWAMNVRYAWARAYADVPKVLRQEAVFLEQDAEAEEERGLFVGLEDWAAALNIEYNQQCTDLRRENVQPPHRAKYLLARFLSSVLTCALCLGFWVGAFWYSLAYAPVWNEASLAWFGGMLQAAFLTSVISWRLIFE